MFHRRHRATVDGITEYLAAALTCHARNRRQCSTQCKMMPCRYRVYAQRMCSWGHGCWQNATVLAALLRSFLRRAPSWYKSTEARQTARRTMCHSALRIQLPLPRISFYSFQHSIWNAVGMCPILDVLVSQVAQHWLRSPHDS